MTKYNVLVKMPKTCSLCGQADGYKYEKVRPTNGLPYEWDKATAEDYVERYSRYESKDHLIIKEV